MQVPTLDYVVERLAQWKGHWRDISAASGVPYDTVTKVAQGKTKNPGFQTVTKLHTHLRSIGDPPRAASEDAAA